MKNKNEKCCSKMSGTNIFIGLLMGIAILIFGGKIILSQTDIPTPQFLDTFKLDRMLEKKNEVNFTGTWTTEGEDSATLTLNEDGTVSDMEDVTGWLAEGNTLTLINTDETIKTMELVDGNLVSGEMVYKK